MTSPTLIIGSKSACNWWLHLDASLAGATTAHDEHAHLTADEVGSHRSQSIRIASSPKRVAYSPAAPILAMCITKLASVPPSLLAHADEVIE
jgi:hypothetical protein